MVYSAVPGNIARHTTGVRVLAVLRDPITRIYSSYLYNYIRHLNPSYKNGDWKLRIQRKKAGAVAQTPMPFLEMVRLEAAFLERCFALWQAKHGIDGELIDIHRDCYSKAMDQQWPGSQSSTSVLAPSIPDPPIRF